MLNTKNIIILRQLCFPYQERTLAFMINIEIIRNLGQINQWNKVFNQKKIKITFRINKLIEKGFI